MKMKPSFLFLLCLLCVCIPKLHAGIELRAKQLTTSHGLPSNSVRCMHQDSKGFLWLGTLDGLTRYDGNTFLTYQLEAGRQGRLSLADNRIRHIAEDTNGFLWVKTVPELFSCYDLQRACFVDFIGRGEEGENYSDIFMASGGDVWLWHKRNGLRRVSCGPDRRLSSVKFDVLNGCPPESRVKFLAEGGPDTLWVGTTHGLFCLVEERVQAIDRTHHYSAALCHEGTMYFLTRQGAVYRYASPARGLEQLGGLPQMGVRSVISTQAPVGSKWLLFTTDRGVYAFHFDTGQITPYAALPVDNGRVIRDARGDCWVYNHTGRLYYLNVTTGTVRQLRLIPEERMKHIDYERYNVVRDDRGTAWISTYGNGLYAYDPHEGQLEHFVSDGKSAGPIGSDFLLCLLKDRMGGIWVSAEYSGLSRLTVSNEGIGHLYPESPEAFDRSNTIRLLAKMPAGNVWVGTRRGGLYNYDARLEDRTGFSDLPYNVYAVSEDSHGILWMGTRGDGLKIADRWYLPQGGSPGAISHTNIYSILRDRRGRMWVGTFGGGLNLAERQADGSYRFRTFFQQQRYGARIVRAMEEDADGFIWMGTSEGVCIFHPDSLLADPQRYHLFSYTDGTFCSNEIRCLCRDRRGRMWVGTSGAGVILCRFSATADSLSYTPYGVAQGLVNNMVQAVLEDDGGHLWVATEYGISRFNPERRSFENFFFSTYTLGNVYSENSACRLADGRLVFGTNYGLTLIDPEKIPTGRVQLPVVITGLSVNGIQVTPHTPGSPLERSLAYSDHIRLKHYQNSFVLDFSTLDFSETGQIKYMYMLENYDKTWSPPSALSFASYKYLRPGNYVFRLKYSDAAGVWSEAETRLTICIVPPFWQTGWAMLCYALLLLVALYFAFRIVRKFNALRNRIDVERQLTEYKLVFFTNISHEFRTPLTLIRGALEKMQRAEELSPALLKPMQVMDKSTRRMLRLINQLLEFRKMQNNKLALSLQETDVVAFLYEIYLTFHDVAEQKQMHYHFVSARPAYKMYVDRSNLDKVVYNLLSNAFKYTPAGGEITLCVEVDELAQRLCIRVEDTGVGIPREKRGELFKRFMQSNFSADSIGVGLHLTHELVQVHKGGIEYREREGGGSLFFVWLPVSPEVYGREDFLVPGRALAEEEEAEFPHHVADPAVEVAKPRRTARRYKVLVVEDDADIRRLLSEELGEHFEVEVAEDGVAGFERACNYEADLIVSDVLMPGMTGFELVRRLKSEFATSHIPVVLLTALHTQDKHLEGLEAGADVYISKPFSIQLLLAQIFRLIERNEELKRRFAGEPGVVRPALCTTDRDKEFADRLVAVVEDIYALPGISIEEFALRMGMGRTGFYKKLRGITGYSPNEYLRIVRMKKAAELLLTEPQLNIAEVAYKVGLNDPLYFSRCFKNQFGVSPSLYQQKMKS